MPYSGVGVAAECYETFRAMPWACRCVRAAACRDQYRRMPWQPMAWHAVACHSWLACCGMPYLDLELPCHTMGDIMACHGMPRHVAKKQIICMPSIKRREPENGQLPFKMWWRVIQASDARLNTAIYTETELPGSPSGASNERTRTWYVLIVACLIYKFTYHWRNVVPRQ